MPKNSTQILIDRNNLLEILRSGQHLLDKRADQDLSSLEIVTINPSSISITMSDGVMMLSANMDVEIVDFDTEIKIYLNPYDIYERIRKIDSVYITLILDDKSIRIEYRETTYQDTLECVDDGNFVLTQLTQGVKMILTHGDYVSIQTRHLDLVNQLKSLKLTMAIDDIRDQFKGVSVLVRGGDLVLWSTDGLKMAITKITGPFHSQMEGIWPRKLIEALCSIMQDCEIEVRIYSKQVLCIINNITIISPLINAKLLDYEKIFNSQDPEFVSAILDASYFSKKLDRIIVVSKNDTSALINISEDSSLSCISSNRADKAEVNFKLVKWNGIQSKIYLSPSTLAGFIRAFKGNVELKIYPSSNNIIVHRENEEYPLYLTKSMRPPKIVN